MDIENLTYILIVILILVYFVTIVLGSKKIKPIKNEQPTIPKFSVNIHFDPYPSEVAIENPYDCNLDSLRVCLISDPTTLFGCKELDVRCEHFDTDMKHYENKVERIIPKNKSPDEGYALVLERLADGCDPYHGDYVLVTADANSKSYMVICNCKNPGYIGNDTMLGNCTTVYICNGKVDNIEQPLEKMECVCDEDQISKRYDDGLPVCQTMTIKDANEKYDDWTNLISWDNNYTLPIEKFHKNISGNIKTKQLIHPCKYNLLDYSELIYKPVYYEYDNRCQIRDGGIPVYLGILDNKPNDWRLSADSIVKTGPCLELRLLSNVDGIKSLVSAHMEDFPYVGTAWITLQNNMAFSEFKEQGSMTIGLGNSSFVGGVCSGSWPNYYCHFNDSTDPNRFIMSIPFPENRDCPGAFLFNRERWKAYNSLTDDSVLVDSQSVTLDSKKLADFGYDSRIVAVRYKEGLNNSGYLSVGEDDFNIHKNYLT